MNSNEYTKELANIRDVQFVAINAIGFRQSRPHASGDLLASRVWFVNRCPFGL